MLSAIPAVRIPIPPASAINEDRPISGLIKAQLLHIQHAESAPLPKNERLASARSRSYRSRTAAYIAAVTRVLTARQKEIQTKAAQLSSQRKGAKTPNHHRAAGSCRAFTAHKRRVHADFRGEATRFKAKFERSRSRRSPDARSFSTDHPLHIAVGSLAPQNGFGAGRAYVGHSRLMDCGAQAGTRRHRHR